MNEQTQLLLKDAEYLTCPEAELIPDGVRLTALINLVRKLAEAVPTAYTAGQNSKIDENTSDGYHTFKELYEYRLLYNAVLFNEWAEQGKYGVHKSERHGDGELAFGGGWFIVIATLPTGQISNHYEMKDWGLFKCEAREKADNWDGHSPKDVATRLRSLAQSAINQEINKSKV